MNEALFQFIWQYSLYRVTGLHTVEGEPLTVIHSGRLNKDAGPDFLEAKIKIGTTTLVGNVEMHIKSSDWLKHGHQNDPAYKNLILHVVYENDVPDVAKNTPVLVLKDSIPAHLISKYAVLMHAPQKLPCAGQHSGVKEITKEAWLSRMLAERWEQKLADWNVMLENSTEDWRNLLYWRMAANFGFKTNATPFLLLAQSLPLNLPVKQRENLTQIEALLFGQAGMLDEDFEDDYPRELQKEYDYLKKKYNLRPIPKHLWKFLRMRPANFPTIRIAQFAALIHKSIHLFSQIIETHSVKEIEPLLDVTASSYWDTHFQFDVAQTRATPKSLGKTSIENIIINTIAPIQFLYAARQDTHALQEKSLQLLEAVPAEKNNITALWEDHGWKAKSAAQSQALIQLYNNYCSQKRCLECTVGLNIIRQPAIQAS
ncbi:MAG: hypothetical protein JWQ38_353 [Flavipsychrobacter sp.]|nr:hypothetical protein [Flavipsychrobacter sp.]